MMDELIIYRTKRVESIIVLLMSVLYLVGSMVALTLPGSLLSNVLFCLVLVAGSILLLTLFTALSKGGICRSMWSKALTLSYPPLNEWEESLEERDAFEVDYNE